MTETLDRPRIEYENPQAEQPFTVKMLDEQEVEKVRKARTSYLKEHNLIGENDLDAEGLLIDHYKDRSAWMGVYSKQDEELRLVAAGRLILPQGSLDTLQVKMDNIVQPDQRVVDRLKNIPVEQIAEVGSLIQLGEDPRANLSLYAGLRHLSLGMGIKKWICGLRQRNSSRFSKTFEPAIERLGDEVIIQGAHDTLIPYLLDLTEGVEQIRERVIRGEGDLFTRRTQALFIDALDSLANVGNS
jgi:hypothetical protein